MPKVYVMAATAVHVLKWRKAATKQDNVNSAAILLWQQRINWLEKELLPSGSGFDSGTTLEEILSNANKLVFNTSFHHMDDNGYYTKWTHHKVTILPSLMNGYDMKISGPNYRGIKDYIVDCFAHAMGREIDWPR